MYIGSSLMNRIFIYIYMSKLELKLLNLHGCFMIWTWILHDFRNSKGYSGVMDFNDTVHIFEVGSHLFESCKHPRVNAIQHFTLYTRLHFYTWDKHNMLRKRSFGPSPLAMCPGNQWATSRPPKSKAVLNFPTLQSTEKIFIVPH